MVNVAQDEFLKLVEQGIKGNANAFSLLCRRLASSLKHTDTELAHKLAPLLAGSVVRGEGKIPAPIDSDSRRLLLREEARVTLDFEPVWTPKVEQMLQQVVLERSNSEQLLEAGLHPIRAVLLSGPPGVGKTLAARWLAEELELPLLTLDLATVMSSFLGRTGGNIRSVIDYASSFPCILLLDELDSIAKRRDDEGDVGELKRLVTVLLQSIDEWPSTSLLVAATNHPDILDSAVWRRFDLTLDLDVPPPELVKRFLIKSRVGEEVANLLSILLAGLPFSSLERVVQAAKKEEILSGRPFEGALISSVLAMQKGEKNEVGRDLAILQSHMEGNSNRQIAKLVGVTHPTVAKILKNYGVDSRE